MSAQFQGRLVFPGGKQELKPFEKEMKKLRAKWVSEMSRRYSRGGGIFKLADLADCLIDTFIGSGTAATMDLIFKLGRGQDEAYRLVVEASDLISKYGAALYDPTVGGTRDPRNFMAESQEILVARQRVYDTWWESNKHKTNPGPPPF